MKPNAKIALAAFVLTGISVFSGCKAGEMTELKDISKPYVGEYKCRELRLGSEDMLEKFEFVKLDLKPGGKFTLTSSESSGKESEYDGEYEFTDEGVFFYSDSGYGRERFLFPYEKGAVEMSLRLKGKLLFARFTMVE